MRQFFFSFLYQKLNSGLCAFQAAAYATELSPWPSSSFYFKNLPSYPGWASILVLCLSLLQGWDHRRGPPHPTVSPCFTGQNFKKKVWERQQDAGQALAALHPSLGMSGALSLGNLVGTYKSTLLFNCFLLSMSIVQCYCHCQASCSECSCECIYSPLLE